MFVRGSLEAVVLFFSGALQFATRCLIGDMPSFLQHCVTCSMGEHR
jgi:hypothetical protein